MKLFSPRPHPVGGPVLAPPIGQAKRPASIRLASLIGFMAALFAAAPVSAQVTIVTIQQSNTGRFVDAHETADQDYRIVTRAAQNNDTQRWIMTPVGGSYTFQQVSTGRYWDAHESANNDFRLVTRPAQNDLTQRWRVTSVGGGLVTMQQVSNGRFVDAYSTSDGDFGLVTREDSFLAAAGSREWRIRVLSEVVPANPGVPVVVIPPIGIPSVISTGAIELSPGGAVNLDNGVVGPSGADLSYEGGLANLRLAPINGARISFTDGTQRGIATAGIASCASAAFVTTPVPLAAVSPGDYVCMRTDVGHISEFRINNIGGVLRRLSISYTTWR